MVQPGLQEETGQQEHRHAGHHQAGAAAGFSLGTGLSIHAVVVVIMMVVVVVVVVVF